MTAYEAARAIAELLKSAHLVEQLPVGSQVRIMYAKLLKNLFTLAGVTGP